MISSHEIEYLIQGNDMQVVSIILDPNETVIAEAGAMNWMDSDISFETKMGDGSKPNQGFLSKLLDMGKRVLTRESLFLTHFTNTGHIKRIVSFAAPYPGAIIPLSLGELGGDVLCQKDAFLCAAKGTEVSIALTRKFASGLFGGEGFILQRLRGNGLAFLHAGGAVIKKELKNETLFIDTGCIVGFSPSLDYDIQQAGNLRSMFFGGEGLFLSKISGSGILYLQTLPFSRLADRIIKHAPRHGGSSKGEGSLLGGLGRMIDGDN